jgi:hypothetical protein
LKINIGTEIYCSTCAMKKMEKEIPNSVPNGNSRRKVRKNFTKIQRTKVILKNSNSTQLNKTEMKRLFEEFDGEEISQNITIQKETKEPEFSDFELYTKRAVSYQPETGKISENIMKRSNTASAILTNEEGKEDKENKNESEEMEKNEEKKDDRRKGLVLYNYYIKDLKLKGKTK